MSIEWKSHIELFQDGLFHKLYHFKALTSLEQLITSVVEKKNNRNEQNFKVYWKTRIRDRGLVKKNLKIK